MSRIADLLADSCPDGVPFYSIGDPRVALDVVAGATPKSNIPEFWNDGTIPWMSSGEVNKGKVFETDKRITQQAYDATSTKLVPAASVVMALAGQGRTRGTVARTRIELCTNQSLASIVTAPTMDSDFLYHYLTTQYSQLRDASSGEGARGGLNLQIIKSYKVPVPPLAVQREIAAILDCFKELEAELEAELGARRRQYAIYRDAMMKLHGTPDVEQVPLGKIATIVRGASPRPIQQFISKQGGVPWIKIGDTEFGGKYVTTTAQRVTEEGAAKSRRVFPGDFLLSNSMSFGRPYIVQVEGCIHDGWLALSGFEDHLSSDFLYHLLRSSTVQTEFARRAGDGTVKNLNADIVRSTVVPVPHLRRQAEIAETLDRLDALTNDLTIGLPAELAARRRQYEYYRDRLLTFEKVPA